jgi:hypothetical protein
MSPQQIISSAAHQTKANNIEWASLKKQFQWKQKIISAFEFILTGLMLKTYLTISWLWLWHHQFSEFSLRMKKTHQIANVDSVNYMKPRLS